MAALANHQGGFFLPFCCLLHWLPPTLQADFSGPLAGSPGGRRRRQAAQSSVERLRRLCCGAANAAAPEAAKLCARAKPEVAPELLAFARAVWHRNCRWKGTAAGSQKTHTHNQQYRPEKLSIEARPENFRHGVRDFLVWPALFQIRFPKGVCVCVFSGCRRQK